VIETGRTSTPTISFINFYDCSIIAGGTGISYWVVTGFRDPAYPDMNGMNVRNCIFNGNTANRDVGIGGSASGTTHKITIEACVFSGNFPDDSFVTLTGDNSADLVTNSYKLFAMNTEYCPAIHLETLSKSPAASTRPFTDTSPLIRSVVPLSSGVFDVTWRPALSGVHGRTALYDRSIGFPGTLSLSASPALDSSRRFSMTSGTVGFTESFNSGRRRRFFLRTSFFLWSGYFSNS
jgi:hypothetical protein